MSLQRRLLCLLGGSFVLLWLLSAGLLYVRLDRQISDTLDQRLAASATMVAGLIARQPELLMASDENPLLVNPESDGVACQIRSASGQVLLETDGTDHFSFDNLQTGFHSRSEGGEEWRLYTLEHQNVLITTADRMTERRDLQNGIIVVMIVPFALALIGSLIALWLGVKQGLRPLHRLFQELRRREPANLDPVTIGDAPAELKPVVATLNELFARVERTLQREQRFASNAAHEFRTPLTAIKTHLQVARKVSGDKQIMPLANAEKGVERLQRVTEQLLMLARLERGSDWPTSAECHVEQVVSGALAELPHNGRVRVDVEDPGAVLTVPGDLAVVAVRNLLENALKYSSPNERVELRTSAAAGKIVFTVRDYGAGDRPQGQHLAGPNPSNQAIQGHGLGLTIVETIASRFSGTLHREHNAPGGQNWILGFSAGPLKKN